MKAKYLFVAGLLLVLASCSEIKGKENNSDNRDIESITENAGGNTRVDPDASGDNKCLLDYQTKYDQLLSEEEVIASTGFSKDVMETKTNKVLKNPEYHDFQYKFKNGRMRSVPMLDRKMKMPDVVVVKNIKAISLKEFENTYRAISTEETQAAKDAFNDAADGKSGNAEADAAIKRAEEQNVSKEQVKDIGSDIADIIKEVSKGYRMVENMGDAARWNIVTNELYVLQNGVQFLIGCDVDDDNEKNKSVAVELAKRILQKCK